MKVRLGSYDLYLGFTPFDEKPLDPKGELFLVCLGKTPNFPPGIKVDELARNQVSVCCMQIVAGGTQKAGPVYGWAALGGDLKDIVAEKLISLGNVPGKWYWMEYAFKVARKPRKRTPNDD